jgi:inosine-uridine nucleoside N-ribohydrolase
MVARMLSLLDRDDVPYAAGPTSPLTPQDAAQRQAAGRRRPLEYAFVGDETPVRPPACGDAIELMYQTICEHAGEVTLVTIGPLTNAATLFRRHPDAAGRLCGLAMMAGNLPEGKAEYNVACDPVAADLALRSPLRKFLGTWEVTRRVVMGPYEIAALRASADPACRGLVEQIDLWWPHRGSKPGPVLYDVCPLAWRFRPEWFAVAERRLGVSVDGPDRGRTRDAPDAPAIAVSVDAQADRVRDLLMETLLEGGGRRRGISAS